MLMFQQFITPQQKEVAAFIDSKGGEACLEDEDVLKELMDYEERVVSSRDPEAARSPIFNNSEDILELRKEFVEKPDEAIEKNSDLFDRKFNMQQRQAENDMAKGVKREGDRIIPIEGVLSAHDMLVDPVSHFLLFI